MKGIGKLEEQRPENPIFLKRGDAVFEVVGVGLGERLPLVGEVSVKLGGEFEAGIEPGSLDPASAHLRGGNPVEGVVELDRIEVLGEVGKRIEL